MPPRTQDAGRRRPRSLRRAFLRALRRRGARRHSLARATLVMKAASATRFPARRRSRDQSREATQGHLDSPQRRLEFALDFSPPPPRFHLGLRRRISPSVRLRPTAAKWHTCARCGTSAESTHSTHEAHVRARRGSRPPKRRRTVGILASSSKWKLATPRKKMEKMPGCCYSFSRHQGGHSRAA